MRPGTISFHRPARVQPAPVEHDVVVIATPPSVPEPIGNAVWQVLAPVLGSAGMVGFALVLGETRYLVMAGLIAGVMLVSGVVSRVVQARSERRRRARAAGRYRAHLSETRRRLDRAASLQRSAAESAHPSPAELVDLVNAGTRTWERRPHHGDFLTVRLGTGPVAPGLTPRLDVPNDPTSEPEPQLLAEARQLEDDTKLLPGLPVSADLGAAGCLAIVGDRETGRRLAASIVAQCSALRSPSDLALVAHLEADATAEWQWLKWLPHARAGLAGVDDGRTLITTTAEDFNVVLDQIATPRLEAIERHRATTGPSKPMRFRQVVILVDGYTPSSDSGRLERLESILSAASEIGVLVIATVDHPDDIPSHAGATIRIGRAGTIDFAETSAGGTRIAGIVPDPCWTETCEEVARALAPLRIRSTDAPASLDSAGLLELLGEQAETVDPERLWQATSDPLTTPIGLCAGGEPLTLDIREASSGGMGPHGILIGATGSGKSELLRTLVLGLALRNPPEELSLVLADFKGGATFAGLDHLPHTAGSISNIEADPTLIDRMQEALFGEMERRQRVLREAGFDRADEYRLHRRLHPEAGLEPLPACLVVVDEFGELLAARPEFVDLFSSIGRTGRSLGVHLLLSSQRLDEGRIRKVESHLRYRICLRTFSPEESIAVIGSRASHDLPPVPGLGHISVDGGLTLFKAGLVNRTIRTTSHTGAGTGAVRRFDIGGPSQTIGLASQPATPPPASSSTEMTVIIERLGAVDRSVRPVWLPPLPDRLPFDETTPPTPLSAIVGVTDLPRRQRLEPAVLDFGGSGGNLAVVGGPRSGKSVTLSTIIASLAWHRSPSEAAFYGIDLGGGLLHRFESLPHVGSVFGRSHREEIPRLVRQIHALIDHRVDEFRIHGLTSMSDFHRARNAGAIESDWGEVFLVIDNWGLFALEFGHELSDLVGEILSGGLHYGVHVILSASRWQDIRLSYRDHIGGRFELRLTDPIESEIDRHAARLLPGDRPGRAIDPEGRITQVSMPPDDLHAIVGRWSGAGATPPIRTLPTLVTEEDLSGLRAGSVGVAEHDTNGWSPDLFGHDPHFVVLGDGEAGKTTTLRGIIRSLERTGRRGALKIGVVDYRRRLASEVKEEFQLGHASTPDEAHALVGRIVSEVAARTVTEQAPSETRPEIVLIVDDYDLVASATGNPIGPVVDLVPRGSDLGFHVVLARRVAGMARSSFEPVLQRIRESGTPTLIMDGDPAEGAIVGSTKAARQPCGRGLLIDRSRATLVQIAHFEPRARVHVLNREQSA
jgi:S-DNA-T family DNA segregation ATPase FtsK/SpoIIIE